MLRIVTLLSFLSLASLAFSQPLPQAMTRTCLFLTGQAKGQLRTFPQGTPARIGQPCQDGAGSNGVAVAPSGSAGDFSMNGNSPVCQDVIGYPVPYKPNEGIPKSGLSTIDANRPVIFLRTSIVDSYPTPVKRFLYAHECGHHALGQVMGALYYKTFIGPPDELAADCFAGQKLKQNSLISNTDWQNILDFLKTIPGDPTTYPGPQRVNQLKGCVN